MVSDGIFKEIIKIFNNMSERIPGLAEYWKIHERLNGIDIQSKYDDAPHDIRYWRRMVIMAHPEYSIEEVENLAKRLVDTPLQYTGRNRNDNSCLFVVLICILFILVGLIILLVSL